MADPALSLSLPLSPSHGQRRRPAALLLLILVAPCLAGCSVRRLAVRTAAHAMSAGGDVYASDDDPELVSAALPFALKTLEGLLAQDDRNPELLLAADRGFTQYAWAFVQLPAERRAVDDAAGAEPLRGRALRLYLRARDYGLRGLARRHPAIADELGREPQRAAAAISRSELPLAYWTAAAWGSAIALGKDQPALLADLPAVRALMERVLALDEGWEHGAAHAAMMSLEAGVPAAAGGSPARAGEHFRRALVLTGGRDATLYVSAAQALAVPAQDRRAYVALLAQALAVDPAAARELRLANTLAREEASWLLAHTDELFVDEEAEPDVSQPTTTEPGAHQP